MGKKIERTTKQSMARPAARAVARLVKIMAKLRAPGGCPWDRKQTHKSLLPYLVEETYELKDAVLARQPERIKEELGDLLLQIVFHAQMASERGRFDLEDVAQGITDKLVRRHPHVFGPAKRRLTPNQVLGNWEKIKLEEKPDRSKSVLEGVPKSMPALLRAYRVQEKVAQFGFDWQKPAEVEAKLHEEVREFHEALDKGDRHAVEEELGDLLFTLVNLARHLRVDPETALNRTSEKFARRFRAMERSLVRSGIGLGRADLETMEAHWQQVKREAGA
jgi:tetrapyrrole methylase family protein/MazG family protein